jgi:hypothetical protein
MERNINKLDQLTSALSGESRKYGRRDPLRCTDHTTLSILKSRH